MKWGSLYVVKIDDESIVIDNAITLYKGRIELKPDKSIMNPKGSGKPSKVDGWIVDVAITTVGNRWEPDDVDVQTVCTSQSVLYCIDFILELCFNNMKEGHMQLIEYQINKGS